MASQEVVADRPLVAFVSGGRETALVAWMRVDGEVELEDLPERARLGLVGLLRVEVQQEPAQALASATLGGDVGVHPRAGVLDRWEGAAALAFVVVVEANRVGAPPVLGDVRPLRTFRPGPSHALLCDGGCLPEPRLGTWEELDRGSEQLVREPPIGTGGEPRFACGNEGTHAFPDTPKIGRFAGYNAP